MKNRYIMFHGSIAEITSFTEEMIGKGGDPNSALGLHVTEVPSISFQYADLQSVLEKKEPRIYILEIPFEKEDFIFSSEDFYGCDDEDTHVHEHFIELRKEYINNEIDIVHFEGGEEPSSIVMKPESVKILSCIIGKEKIEAFIEKFEQEFIPYDDYEKRNSVVKNFLTSNKQRRRNKP